MPFVATNKSAVLKLRDGSGTPKLLEVFPQEGNVTLTPGETELIEVPHRGAPIADGEGIIGQNTPMARVSFDFYVHDLTDAVKPDALFRWMRKTTDASAAAVVTASWTSTTTRTDGKATLDVLYYPQGTGSGAPVYTVADCIIVSKPMTEGAPSVFAVELMSTTSAYIQLSFV